MFKGATLHITHSQCASPAEATMDRSSHLLSPSLSAGTVSDTSHSPSAPDPGAAMAQVEVAIASVSKNASSSGSEKKTSNNKAKTKASTSKRFKKVTAKPSGNARVRGPRKPKDPAAVTNSAVSSATVAVPDGQRSPRKRKPSLKVREAQEQYVPHSLQNSNADFGA